MEKHQVLLVSMQPLLSEGLVRIFHQLEDVQLVSLESTDIPTIEASLKNIHPEIILLAGEKEDDAATHLISTLLKHCADIPIVWIELETNLLRLYTSRVLPASSAELIQAIHQNNFRQVTVKRPRKNRTETQRRE